MILMRLSETLKNGFRGNKNLQKGAELPLTTDPYVYAWQYAYENSK